MPGGFPLGNDVCNLVSVGADLTNSVGTQINANAAANTLGSFVQLIASTASDACGLTIEINAFVNAGPSAAVDIAIGGAGSEVVIANQLVCYGRNSQGTAGGSYYLPISIPAGTRISARCQVDRVNDGVFVNAQLWDGGFSQWEGYAGVASIGFNSSTTLGTLIDPGGTINTKGSYAQLTASTTRDYAGFIITADMQASSSASTLFQTWLIDIAIGAAASEVVIIPNWGQTAQWVTGFAQTLQYISPVFWVNVPLGTRLSARSQCSSNDATGRLIGVTLYGIYQ